MSINETITNDILHNYAARCRLKSQTVTSPIACHVAGILVILACILIDFLILILLFNSSFTKLSIFLLHVYLVVHLSLILAV